MNEEEQYWIDKGSTDANLVSADKDGRHPRFQHLVLYELESHYGSWIVTSPAKKGSVLIGHEDCLSMFGEEVVELEFGFATDEYLELIT